MAQAARQAMPCDVSERTLVLQDFDEDDAHSLGTLHIGGINGVWPNYLRVMFISGYRYVQSLDATALPCDKQEILDVILECCPSHKHKVKNTFEGSCNNAYHALHMSMSKSGASSFPGGGFGGGSGSGGLFMGALSPMFAGNFTAHDYYSEASIIRGSRRMYLNAAGLDPIVELALVHQQDIPPNVVRRAGAMLKTLKPFVPQSVADLAGTPYDAADPDSLDGIGCVQLVKDFITLFEKAADFGDCIAEQW